jgi:hypothetical protein
VAPLFLALTAYADLIWISDIRGNLARWWNREVTLEGKVSQVLAIPMGTTEGFYLLLDESSTVPIAVRTADLPPVGKKYTVTGAILQCPPEFAQDPAISQMAKEAFYMKEVSRKSPGLSSTMMIILIAAGALFLILLIIFIVLLTRPKKRPAVAETVRPAYRPAPAAAPPMPEAIRTTKLPPTPVAPAPAAPPPAKTRVFVSLGADLIVEKGPDRGKEFAIYQQVMTIGRPGTRKNDVELSDDTVSKEQASVYFDSARRLFSIANESSTNPTQVNGQPISGPTLLENGCLIEMGRTAIRFRKE